ncbi:MAG TPA: CoA transferase [Pseudolysinimonas sp.]|nr:CoA transferase [Pseudolysinimonas sp.]
MARNTGESENAADAGAATRLGRGPRPLDGYLIADLSRVLAGPTATMMLADLGARVIKVERPGLGDDTRQFGPPWAGSSSAYFESANRTKQSIALDLDDPADRELAHQLTDRADIVVENYRTGALARFGLDYPSVRQRNPRVIYASITGFGSAAGAGEPGYDFLVQAVGGLMSITGQPDSPAAGHPAGEPTKVGVAIVDLLAAKDVVMAILAAALHREQTGTGQHVEIDLLSSALAALANQGSSYLATGRSPGRLGNRHPSIAPYETVRCRDGYLAIAVANDRQWRAVVAMVAGLTSENARELASERFATNPGRVEHHDQLIGALERVFATDDTATWIARLRTADVPAGPVNDIAAAIELARQYGLDPVADVGAANPPQIRHPVRYSAFNPVPPVAPPALDQHGDQIREWLRRPRDRER